MITLLRQFCPWYTFLSVKGTKRNDRAQRICEYHNFQCIRFAFSTLLYFNDSEIWPVIQPVDQPESQRVVQPLHCTRATSVPQRKVLRISLPFTLFREASCSSYMNAFCTCWKSVPAHVPYRHPSCTGTV